MTYSRARSTTIGPGCLTAVFGMGTGVAIRVWSPGSLALYQEGSGRVVVPALSPVSWLAGRCGLADAGGRDQCGQAFGC